MKEEQEKRGSQKSLLAFRNLWIITCDWCCRITGNSPYRKCDPHRRGIFEYDRKSQIV